MTRDQIADAALAIVERDGAEALSMRKLAAELGVTSTTIYWHVGGRDEVLAAALERFRDRHRPRRIAGASAQARIVSILRQMRDEALEHANVFSVAYDVGLTGRLQLPWQQVLAGELLAAGLEPAVAADAMRGLLYTVGGFIVVALRRAEENLGSEQAWAELADPALDPSFRDRMSQPPDFDAVFDRAATALVEGLVPKET
jgi:TetR/AcrR family transcriptional regulator, tetracycline repressor protein